MAKGMTVVVPPQAADVVPERKSSHVVCPSQGCWSMWQWLSTPPGVTSLPVASIVCSALPRSSPSATTRPPCTAISQRMTSPAVATVPLRIRRSKDAANSMLLRVQFFLASRDIGVQRLDDGGIHCRLLITLEHVLPDAGGALGRVLRPGDLPVLVVLPVGEQRRIERGLVARQSVLCAEEVPAGRHVSDRLQALGDLEVIHRNRRDGHRHHLQHLDVQDHLLEGGG